MLREKKLHCNPKKSEFFLFELTFLGHKVSQKGIEACSSKTDHILEWLQPKSATDVRAFLGLVRYIAAFLLKLAKFTVVLNELTTKESQKNFPPWMEKHQAAFEAVKGLVLSQECLTMIDHELPGENKIFVTTDASDLPTRAVLSWGPTWETARPVTFNSMQLKGAQ